MQSFFYKRAAAVYCIMLLLFGFLILRLYKLSDGNYSEQVLSGQYIRKIDIASRDGFIYDKNLKLLSHKKDGSVVLINPAQLTQSISSVAFEAGRVCEGYTATDISDALKSGECLKLFCTENSNLNTLKGLNGVYVFDSFEEKTSAALHLIGYENIDGNGMCGLKKQYKDILQTLSGRVSASFNCDAVSGIMPGGGFYVRDNNYTQNSGVVLTLDKQLQSFIESLEGEYIDKGAVVVTDVNTGEILAAASFPSYDENNVESYLESQHGELVNRIAQTYTPGSVFKLAVAAAALEKSLEYADFTYECKGSIEVLQNSFGCHKREGHGVQNLEEAFANSCNCYFVALGQKTGISCILQTAKSMGAGNSVYADFLQSTPATLLNKKTITDTLVANISFGQGTLLLSPLDMVNVTNACATGFLPDLRLVKGIYAENSLKENTFDEKKRVLKAQTVEKLKSMMGKCVTDGTGKGAYIKGVSNGGKTATAQTGQKDRNNEEILHKWFCGIYPKNTPEVSIIVFCDGTGRNNALPAEIFGIVNKFVVNAGILNF